MLVIEYASGGSLLERLRTEVVSYEEKLQWLVDICNGMSYLHKRRPVPVLHGDLSARNVLLKEARGRWTAMVSDFGLAQTLYSESFSTSNLITFDVDVEKGIPLRWAAPELLQYHSISAATDVWAFGVLAWEVLTNGNVPYGHLTDQQVMKHVIQGERLDCPMGVDPFLFKQVVSSCFRPAKDRPTFAMLSRRIRAMVGGSLDSGASSEQDSPSVGRYSVPPL